MLVATVVGTSLAAGICALLFSSIYGVMLARSSQRERAAAEAALSLDGEVRDALLAQTLYLQHEYRMPGQADIADMEAMLEKTGAIWEKLVAARPSELFYQ